MPWFSKGVVPVKTWKPQVRPGIEEIINTTVRNRMGMGKQYQSGAAERINRKLIDRYWLGWFTSDKKFIDACEQFILEEEC